jgi:excisionase family DNA binding protein
MNFENPKLKDVNSVSDLLGCKPITIYRLVKSGKFPHKRIGALLRFSDSDIQSYLDSAKVEKAEGKNEN